MTLLTDFCAFVIFALVNLSAIALRLRHPELDRPFRVPLNVRNIPLVSVLGLLSCMAMLLTFEAEIIAAFVGLTLAGFAAHALRRRRDYKLQS